MPLRSCRRGLIPRPMRSGKTVGGMDDAAIAQNQPETIRCIFK